MKLLFIDFEANGLGKGVSYPISVGYIVYDTESERVVSDDYFLIKPTESWCEENWDWYAEKYIHKLKKKDLLDKGVPVVESAERLKAMLDVDMIVSDAPSYDRGWFKLLISEAGMSDTDLFNCEFTRLQELVDLGFVENNSDRIQGMFEHHNALEDARRNLKLYTEYQQFKKGSTHEGHS